MWIFEEGLSDISGVMLWGSVLSGYVHVYKEREHKSIILTTYHDIPQLISISMWSLKSEISIISIHDLEMK